MRTVQCAVPCLRRTRGRRPRDWAAPTRAATSAPTSSPRAAETTKTATPPPCVAVNVASCNVAVNVAGCMRCNQCRPLHLLHSMSCVAALPHCMPPVVPSRWRALRIDGTLHLMHDVGLEELYHTLYVKASAEARAAWVPRVCRVGK